MIEKIKKNKAVIVVIAVVLLIFGAVFALEGRNVPESKSNISDKVPERAEIPETEDGPKRSLKPSSTPAATEKPEATLQVKETPKPKTNTAATAQPEEQASEIGDEYTLGDSQIITYSSQSDNKSQDCTIAIYCKTLLENTNLLDSKKHSLIPSDGCILPEFEVEINDGDSVFDILKRATKDNKIHMEFVNTPIYNSAYVEGINNIYEFDAGELSGWMYSVNGDFPNRGSSGYKVKAGDKIEWHYTCDLGRDVSGRIVNQRDE